MSPKEFTKRMQIIVNTERREDDPESTHFKGDELMIAVLNQLGYKEGTDLYLSLTRWYA